MAPNCFFFFTKPLLIQRLIFTTISSQLYDTHNSLLNCISLSIYMPISPLFAILFVLTPNSAVIGSSYSWAWLATVWWASIRSSEHTLLPILFFCSVFNSAILNIIFSYELLLHLLPAQCSRPITWFPWILLIRLL